MNWNPPIDTSTNDARKNSIPSFLGFNTPAYYPYNKYYSYKINSNLFSFDSLGYINNVKYSINSSNNYVTIYQYTLDTTNSIAIEATFGDTNNRPHIDFSFNITLSIIGQHTASEIVTELSNQISNSPYLDTNYSYINRIDMSGNPIYGNQSYYELALKINRFTVFPSKNAKIAIQFPLETPNSPTWTSSISCFKFNSTTTNIFDLNDIISDTKPVPQELLLYTITTNCVTV
jgi:hypothetical protein